MSNASDLLRMLEPAVRPVGLPGGSARQPARADKTPFEQQSFDQLLASARQGDPPQQALDAAGAGEAAAAGGGSEAVGGSKAAGATQPPSPLAALGQMNRIENASLRALFDQQMKSMKQ